MVNKKKVNLKITGTLILLLTLIFFISLISSVGIATSYWDDNPLKLAPGESAIISLRLQSDGGETTLRAALDSPIAKLIEGPEYTILAGTESVPANISVEIPEDAEIGTKYQVYVDFQEVSTGEGGMLHVAQGVTSKVPVEVVGEQESALYGQTPKRNNVIWIILGLAVLVAVFLIVKMNKRGR